MTPLRQVTRDFGSPWIAGLTIGNSGDWAVMVRVIDPPPEEHERARVNGRVDVSLLERFDELVLLDGDFNEVEVLVRGKRSNWNISVFHGQDISDDGNIVVYGLWNNDAYDFDTVLMDRRTGETRVIAPRAGSPQLSPDARQVLVVASPGDTSPGLFILSDDGIGMRRLTPQDEYSAEARW